MGDFHYGQLCPIARAAELVGERWTLLILRELFAGPQRFTDLRQRLPALSSSVLTQRLTRLERHGLIGRSELPPPASSTVYELREAGQALLPAMLELARWGVLFLFPPRPGETLPLAALGAALRLCARRTPTPAYRIQLHLTGPEGDRIALHVTGGANGTQVREGEGPADVTLSGAPSPLFGLLIGSTTPEAARAGGLQLDGDPDAWNAFPDLFEPLVPPGGPAERSSATPTQEPHPQKE